MIKRSTKSAFLIGFFLLLLSIGQTTYATPFSFALGSSDVFLGIDFEGSGTIQHMNANNPTIFSNGPTSLLDIHVTQGTDLRIAITGGNFTLKIGQPGNLLADYSTFGTDLVIVSETPGLVVFALSPIEAANLQNLIEAHGAGNLFLALDFFGGGLNTKSISVFSAVPEPSSVFLLCSGVAFFLAARRSQGKKSKPTQ